MRPSVIYLVLFSFIWRSLVFLPLNPNPTSRREIVTAECRCVESAKDSWHFFFEMLKVLSKICE